MGTITGDLGLVRRSDIAWPGKANYADRSWLVVADGDVATIPAGGRLLVLNASGDSGSVIEVSAVSAAELRGPLTFSQEAAEGWTSPDRPRFINPSLVGVAVFLAGALLVLAGFRSSGTVIAIGGLAAAVMLTRRFGVVPWRSGDPEPAGYVRRSGAASFRSPGDLVLEPAAPLIIARPEAPAG